jgi:hypothetical protein
MIYKKYISFLLFGAFLASVYALEKASEPIKSAQTEEIKPPLCNTEEGCKNRDNKNCTCWCSVECGPRHKKPTDVGPLWKEGAEDKYGKKCYCQQRDIDLYEPNQCALKEKQKALEKESSMTPKAGASRYERSLRMAEPTAPESL